MLRAAIIGCGGISERHGRGLSISDRCAVVAGADITEANLNRTCDLLAISHRYLDHRDLLRIEKPDIVAICTWPGTHASITLDCVHAGVRGILCEKPLAVSPEECDQMIDTCREAHVFLGTGHHYRFQPTVVTSRDLVRAGALGEIAILRSCSRDGLANNASHLVDLARFILDDPAPEWAFAQVERTTNRHERAIPIEDRAIGEIGFVGGHRLLIESDVSSEPIHLLVVGEKGCIRVEAGRSSIQTANLGWQELPPTDAPGQHAAFLDWVEGGNLYPSNGENGRWAVECINALYYSAWKRRRITLPLHDRAYPVKAMIADGVWAMEQPTAYDIRSGGPRWRKGP